MSKYTNQLTARQVLEYIANDYVELSHDKVRLQRDDYIKICREWLLHNYTPEMELEGTNAN